MVNRGCTFVMPDGHVCRSPAIRGERHCRMHDPERAEEVAETRRLGGVRRRRERTLAGAYELGSVRSVDDLFRVAEIAVFDLLGMETSIPKSRALLHAVSVGAALLRTGELEDRVGALERARSSTPGPELGRGLLDEPDA